MILAADRHDQGSPYKSRELYMQKVNREDDEAAVKINEL